ncbi:MAG: hypothetical protein PHQ40_20880, partial [Anaerolineaceae bacterium]|nr:hypothetical protein [Anaerolineaceae bacterium]
MSGYNREDHRIHPANAPQAPQPPDCGRLRVNPMQKTLLEGEKKTQPTRVLIVSILILMVILFFVSREMEAVKEFIRSSGWIGILVSIALYGVLGASVIPSEPLTILMSTVFGPFW